MVVDVDSERIFLGETWWKRKQREKHKWQGLTWWVQGDIEEDSAETDDNA